MIVRMKSGQYQVSTVNALLEYLGVKNDTAEVQKVDSDVELIASVPFQMKREERKEKNDNGFAWTLSTFDLDRMGERIDPTGWDFKQYMRNPIVEWSHRYDIPAIGKIDGLTIDDEGLHGVVIFNDKEYDPFAWSIEQRIKAGVLRAGSVGFRALEIEIPDRKTAEDGTYLIFRKQELLEFSICNVPANPYALASPMLNEELGMRNEKSRCLENVNNANQYWGGIINIV